MWDVARTKTSKAPFFSSAHFFCCKDNVATKVTHRFTHTVLQMLRNTRLFQSSRHLTKCAMLQHPVARATMSARRFIQPFAAVQQQQQQRTLHAFQPLRRSQEAQEEEPVDPKHQLLIGFTCEVCKDRSHHIMSKLAYTKGVVLIECPGCKNRHLIADNLGWFRDQRTTVEDLVKEKGEAVRKVIVDGQGQEHISNLMEWLPDELNNSTSGKKSE